MRLATVLAVSLVGCGRPSAPDARLHLGTGASSFVELDPDQPLTLWQGPQGGYHLQLNARVFGLDTASTRLTFRAASSGTGDAVCEGTYPRAVFESASDGWEQLPDGARCYVADPTGLTGAWVELSAAATDSSAAASDLRRAVLGEVRRTY